MSVREIPQATLISVGNRRAHLWESSQSYTHGEERKRDRGIQK